MGLDSPPSRELRLPATLTEIFRAHMFRSDSGVCWCEHNADYGLMESQQDHLVALVDRWITRRVDQAVEHALAGRLE